MAIIRFVTRYHRSSWFAFIAWLSAAGCAHHPSSTLPAVLPPISVVYSAHPDSEVLAPEQISAITAAAERVRPKDHSIWFVVVHLNRPAGSLHHYRVTVYFAPDEQSPRLRKGRCVRLDDHNSFPPSPGDLSQLGKQPSLALEPYLQISDSTEPFTHNLSAPKPASLPFPPPENLSYAETIAIVDFLHSFGDKSLMPPPPTTQAGTTVLRNLPDHIDTDSPILRITASGDDIEVMFGWIAGPLYGGGTSVRLRRKAHGYEVISVTSWYA